MKMLLLVPFMYKKYHNLQVSPPLGISSIGATLTMEGHRVYIYDASLDDSVEPTMDIVRKFRPDIVGLSFTTIGSMNAVRTAIEVKKLDPGIIVVCGGVHVSALAEPFLLHYPSVDIVVRGEGEYTMLDLVNSIEKGMVDLKGILGITYRDHSKIQSTPARPLIEDLDKLPFASNMFHFYDFKRYSYYEDMPLDFQKEIIKAPIMSSRGCPFNCTFCYSPNMWGRRYRTRSPKNVVDEIEMMISKFDVKYVRFFDDNFYVSEKHVVGICNEILERDLDFAWRCEARVGPPILKFETLKKMRSAGCEMIELGVESGSPRVLKVMRKGTDVPVIKHTFEVTRKAGLIRKAFIMHGLPRETIYDTFRTMILLSQIKPDMVNIGLTQVLPSAQMYLDLLREGKIDEEIWFTLGEDNDVPLLFKYKNLFSQMSTRIMGLILMYYCRWKEYLKYKVARDSWFKSERAHKRSESKDSTQKC